MGRDGLAGLPDDVRTDRRRTLLHQHLGLPASRRSHPGDEPGGHRSHAVRRRRDQARPVRAARRGRLRGTRRADRRRHCVVPRATAARTSPARARRRPGSSRRGARQACEQLERRAARPVRIDAAVDGVRLRHPVHRIVGQPSGVRLVAGRPGAGLRRRGVRARAAIGDGHRGDRVGRRRQGSRLTRRARG